MEKQIEKVNVVTFRRRIDAAFRVANVDYCACRGAYELKNWLTIAERVLAELVDAECSRATAVDRDNKVNAQERLEARIDQAQDKVAVKQAQPPSAYEKVVNQAREQIEQHKKSISNHQAAIQHLEQDIAINMEKARADSRRRVILERVMGRLQQGHEVVNIEGRCWWMVAGELADRATADDMEMLYQLEKSGIIEAETVTRRLQ
ncbi:MAG: hypothetical protein CL539_18605 [Alcanivorax sp.]|jgi:hypothetical protein|uniref:hypothetical protein n=1 Tax=Alcanivorax sp. TaxID=1872427 RepID=UPI000C90EB17|nr:hypothetical protein [Alcanivorax sp.]MAC16660.1 hypothetical protein [Alcanivorax sp.]|tara:strand:+ start:6044 stop:6658 length:615 start_codon:yes stop_codon:yes gene_type:complete